MRLKTELAIKADIESLPPKAWNRRDFEKYLAERREALNIPQYLTTSGLIDFWWTMRSRNSGISNAANTVGSPVT